MSELHTTTPRLPIPFRRRVLITSIVMACIALIEIQFSIPSWFLIYDTIRWLDFDNFYMSANHFPEKTVYASLIIAIWILKREWRSMLVPLLIAVGIASGITGVVKEVTGRARPEMGIRLANSKEKREEVAEYLKENPNPVLKPEAGDYWLWLSPHRPWFRGDYASFPSGHATSAFVLAVWLTILFPKAQYLWYFLAFGTCIARIRLQRHYPGDVTMGAALGYLVAHWIFASPRISIFGQKVALWLERRLGDTEPIETKAIE